MAYAQLASSHPASLDARAGLRHLALTVLRPFAEAHRRLLQRQRLEALSDRLLLDVGIAREDLPALLRRR